MGGKGEGATYKSRVWIQHRGASCAAWWAWAVSPEHFIISVTDQEGHYCFPNVLVRVCCMLAGTLLVCVPCMLRKAEEGHGATGSLRVHRVERKQALVSERLATSCSEARVYRGHCLSSGYPVSKFTV